MFEEETNSQTIDNGQDFKFTITDFLKKVIKILINDWVGLYPHSAKQIIPNVLVVKKFTYPVWVQILPVCRAG